MTGTRLTGTPYNERRTEPHGAGKECVSVFVFCFILRQCLVRRGKLFAGAIRPGAALFVPRVRELYSLHVVAKLAAAQKHGVSFGNTARMASTSAKMLRSQITDPDLSGPLAG